MSFSVTPFGIVKAGAQSYDPQLHYALHRWSNSGRSLNSKAVAPKLRESLLNYYGGRSAQRSGVDDLDAIEALLQLDELNDWKDPVKPQKTDLAAYTQLVGKAPVSGFEVVDKDMRNWVKETSKEARCWEGYEPVPGKKPYSKGSCRPKGTKKKTTEKTAENFNLGSVAAGAGPQQMYHALNMLNQARVLVDPTETLKKNQLSRGDFESTIKQLANRSGDSYDFDTLRRDPKRRAMLMGVLGSALGGAAGYARNGIGGALGGAALGGLGGAGYGHVNATNYNRKLLGTARVLKNYGLLQPEYLRAALPLLQKTSSDTYAKQAFIAWGGGKLGLHPKGLGVGGEIGYSNLLGLLPIPMGGVDIGGPRKGFLMGVTPDPESEFGVSPYLGVRWNHPRASGITRNFPRGLPEVIYDKLRGRTKLDAMRLSYPELFEEEQAEEPVEESKAPPKEEKKAAAVRKLQLLLTKHAMGTAAPQQQSGLGYMKERMARQKADFDRQAAILKANNMTSGTFVQGQLQLPGGATPKPALPPAGQDYINHELLNKIVQQRRQRLATGATTVANPKVPGLSTPAAMPRQPNPSNQIENKSVTSRSLTDIMRQRQAPKAPAAPKMPASGIPNKSYTSPSAADFLKKRGSEGGAWTRAEGKSESGGLNAKGRASLKAQGQDIKPPVTESNPTGERADRKKSFCARMSGHKAKNTSAETARDPDSRINKALRKWRC